MIPDIQCQNYRDHIFEEANKRDIILNAVVSDLKFKISVKVYGRMLNYPSLSSHMGAFTAEISWKIVERIAKGEISEIDM